MQPSAWSIGDDLDAPPFAQLLDCFSVRARMRPAARPRRREHPALDSCRLLGIFSPFPLRRDGK